MIKKRGILILLAMLIPYLSGCVKLALQASPSLIPHLTGAIFEECDVELAKQALPSDLKLMEGLLKNDPHSKQILTALCMGFTGYAMLFVEEDAPDRASRLYLRAKEYGLRALGPGAGMLGKPGVKKETLRGVLSLLGEEELEALFWTAMSWNAWLNLNLDKPAALAQLPAAQACLERVMEIKPDYFYGTPYILMGSILASMPATLGGKPARAKAYFEKAIHSSQGKFFLAQYYFAKYYAVRVQDKNLFVKLVREVESAPSFALKEVCLINEVIREKTRRLMGISDELFF